MAAVTNGHVNGDLNGTDGLPSTVKRFSDIPPAIDIPVAGGDIEEAVEVNLEGHLDDPTELCQLLENERAAKNLWITIALAYAKQQQIDHAIDILNKGLSSLSRSGVKERLGLLCCIAWLDLLKSREAPRIALHTQPAEPVKTKDDYHRETTSTINDALRINPAFPPLHLIRGVLFLLKAGVSSSGKPLGHGDGERYDFLRQAQKCFEDAVKSSGGRNMMAVMGKARALYLLGKPAEALLNYQEILSKMPTMTDPDPRIGIGCCFWQLGHPERAQQAWERSLALNPESKIAHALLGIYYLHESAKYPASDPQFNILYKKAMIDHTKKAYTIDKNFPLSCATFASYFLLTGRYDNVDPLARKAIEQTDSSAIASDGWYLLARKEHNKNEFTRAKDYYNRSDQARGGNEKGYWPAKFGNIQMMIQTQDTDGAKFRLEKLLQSSRSLEASTLLGALYAEEVFASPNRDEKSTEAKKAISLLETVRKSWKDEKAKSKPDESVLLYLARLYELDQPIESMKCLAEVESMQLDKIPDEDRPDPEQEEAIYLSQLREHIPPQLLNNMACFMYGSESYTNAQETFQIALNACVKLNERQEAEKRAAESGEADPEDVGTKDTDALVTTISYNLARTYEALGLLPEAQKVYEGLLTRHPDYTDASARLAYMALRASPQDEGPRKIQTLYSSDYADLEVRALMGWYQNRSKKRTLNIAEDQEHRHYKHTLQGYDKHDKYALTGMGNIHLMIARDMPRNTDAEKDKRSKMYQKAVEFFDKALQLDPRNAYAAQGIAIAMCDDKRNFSEAVQIFSKVKETIRDTSVYTNLGHVYTELKQFQRAIDHYDLALKKDGKGENNNPLLLACLSRAWLLKGKQDRSISALNTSLDFMQRALAAQPDSVHLQFNIAFLQFQIAQLVNGLPEQERTLEDVLTAASGLEDAIVTFGEIAKVKQPPYPRGALEQRAAMAKNTMRKQLERAEKAQREYEEKNKENLERARRRREEDLKRREEAARRRREEEEERSRKVMEERQKLIEQTERMAEQLRAEQMAREAAEYTEDEETGDRVKRKSKRERRGEGGGAGKRKKRTRDVLDDGFIEDDEATMDDEEGLFDDERSESRTPMDDSDVGGGGDRDETSRPSRRERAPTRKRRKLERRSDAVTKAKPPSRKEKKYKSEAVVVDSSDSEDEQMADVNTASTTRAAPTPDANVNGEDEEMNDEAVSNRPRQRKMLRTIADDDDEDDDEEDLGQATEENMQLARAALATAGSPLSEGDEE